MFLTDSAAARFPHETVVTKAGRKLLAVAQNNGENFALYDISDCRHPVLNSSIQLLGSVGHMGASSPDGMTYYLSQAGHKKGNGNGADLDVQLWTVSDGHGFQVPRFSQDFLAKNKDLFNREQKTARRE